MSAISDTDAGLRPAAEPAAGPRAIVASVIGNVLEWYDFAV